MHAAALCAAAAAARAAPPSAAALRAALQPVADAEAEKYNCSVAIALHRGTGAVQVAAGMQPDAVVAWGSATKVLTGAATLRLVADGAFGLDDAAAPLVDPFLAALRARDPAQNFSSLADLFGEGVARVTVRELLSMQSGIPDFDTAMPCGGDNPPPGPRPPGPHPPPGPPKCTAEPCYFCDFGTYTCKQVTGGPISKAQCDRDCQHPAARAAAPPAPCVPDDPLRARFYADPGRFWSPTELLSVPWVAKGALGNKGYSSTNFVILGMILAGHANVSSWEEFDQSSAIPAAALAKYAHLSFARSGAPADYTDLRGYDATSYNNNTGRIDISHVDGVLAGWTAADILGTPADLARLVWDVYGPEYNVAPKAMVDQMPPEHGYGLATFDLSTRTGRDGAVGKAYGHLGSTYGYQSIVSFHPELEFSLAIGTNIETNDQAQPADALCMAYSAVADLYQGTNTSCTFASGGYWNGGCSCSSA